MIRLIALFGLLLLFGACAPPPPPAPVGPWSALNSGAWTATPADSEALPK